MFRKLAIATLVLLFFAPATALLGIGALMNPAAAHCSTHDTPVHLGPVPDSLTVTTANGERFTLNHRQLTHAATIIATGNGLDDVGRLGIKIALMAALTESTLRMLANTDAYPESGNYPNDGNGSDHDSLGLFQMRPQTGWGTVADLMDPTYQARAFFGGPTGPNHPSPRGLLDIPGWQEMDPGEAAQAVEVSAHPDRYRNYAPAADTILTALTSPGAMPAAGGPASTALRVVFPLPENTWVLTSPFGTRVHPITGRPTQHTGTDYAAPDGTPILAAADGVVTVAGPSGGYGNLIVIEHTIDGQTVATAYAHMWQSGIHVQTGDRVTAGQHIGDVGSSGMSTGPHLHFEVRPGGTSGEPIDSAAWLTQHAATQLPAATSRPPDACNPTGTPNPPSGFDGDPDRPSTTPPAAARSPPDYSTSTSKPSPRSPTPSGPATHPAPARNPSTPSAAPATSPSATRSATTPTRNNSKPAGKSPTG